MVRVNPGREKLAVTDLSPSMVTVHGLVNGPTLAHAPDQLANP